MYAQTSIRDAYHKLKNSADDCLLAFQMNEFFMFVLGDAKKIVNALPDISLFDGVEYDAVRIHQLHFDIMVSRLKSKNLKVVKVVRSISTNNKTRYRIERINEG